MSALEITPAFQHPRLRSGVTQTNRDLFPLPGLTFSTSASSSADLVQASRAELAAAVDVDLADLQFMSQVHGSTVVRIESPTASPEADALITNVPGIVLCATIADCCAVLLFDEANAAVAAVHSGWRGTQLNIVTEAIRAMQAAYGTEPGHLAAFLSPCASGARYEVDADVAAFFPDHVRSIGEGKYLFDNQSAIRQLLEQAGVPSNGITADPTCTMVDPRYHSHRRDGALAGRGVGFIGIQ